MHSFLFVGLSLALESATGVIGSLRAPGASECSLICDLDPRCQSSVYTSKSTMNCQITTNSDQPSIEGSTVHKRGSKKDLEYDVDYVGNDVAVLDASSLEQCREYCMLDSRSLHFTYKTSTKKCHIKNSRAGRIPAQLSSFISGSKPIKKLSIAGLLYNGPNSSVPMAEHHDCPLFCRMEFPTHRFWTHFSNKCFCISSDAPTLIDYNVDGRYSGILPDNYVIDKQHGLSFSGKAIGIPSWESSLCKCEQECLDTCDCNYYSYDEDTEVCSCFEEVSYVNYGNAVSGEVTNR